MVGGSGLQVAKSCSWWNESLSWTPIRSKILFQFFSNVITSKVFFCMILFQIFFKSIPWKVSFSMIIFQFSLNIIPTKELWHISMNWKPELDLNSLNASPSVFLEYTPQKYSFTGYEEYFDKNSLQNTCKDQFIGK